LQQAAKHCYISVHATEFVRAKDFDY